MANKTVLIIGCGIAGPVLALLLKRKGYHPIVFEKVKELGDAGASLMLMPNGLKVLGLFGLTDAIYGDSLPLQAYEDRKSNGTVLAGSLIPSHFSQRYGYAAVGVRRTNLNLKLKRLVEDEGIEVRQGWGLESIEEGDDTVTATFTNGKAETGAFLVGCDGIRASSRSQLLAKRGNIEASPVYTGLSQTAGISATPDSFLASESAMCNWYGDGVHVIAYPVSATHTSWAITRREAEQTKESWHLYSQDGAKQLSQELLAALNGYDPAVLGLVGSVERVTRYGLFDRTDLPPDQWHSSRCVLVGDAAHPTSPHLGQGANQALEDCYHLARLLPNLSPETSPQIQLEYLQRAFQSYATLRQPRTAALVKGARAQGEKRVASGELACRQRNQDLVDSWRDASAVSARFEGLLMDHPFVYPNADLDHLGQ